MEQVLTEKKLETKKKFNPIIFISDYIGFAPQDEKGKPICRFSPFAVVHPQKGQISKGHYICMDKKIYDKLIWFMDNTTQKSMQIVKRLPRDTNAKGNVLKGVATGIAGDVPAHQLITLDDEGMGLVRELGQLETKYYTTDSGYSTFKGNIREDSQKKITERVKYIKNTLKLD